VFNIATLCFDDNNVLKVQLDMLIFVQVCRTIIHQSMIIDQSLNL